MPKNFAVRTNYMQSQRPKSINRGALNLVEGFFGIATEKQMRRSVFTSVTELKEKIKPYIEKYHESSRRLVWTKTAEALIVKVGRARDQHNKRLFIRLFFYFQLIFSLFSAYLQRCCQQRRNVITRKVRQNCDDRAYIVIVLIIIAIPVADLSYSFMGRFSHRLFLLLPICVTTQFIPV